MKLTGSKILLECLLQEGVDTIFGYPGGTVINIYDDLMDSPVKHILTRHEQAAVHAADGYARATGKVGVAIATSGPGATNTITGIATAYMDSIPMVVITGQVPTPLIGNDAFQEADVIGLTRPITKHNYLVRDIKDLAMTVKKAFYIARTGRPGPVVIDLPKDVQIAAAKFEYPESVELRGYKPTFSGNTRMIDKAAKMILSAKRPVLYVGGGASLTDAHDYLVELDVVLLALDGDRAPAAASAASRVMPPAILSRACRARARATSSLSATRGPRWVAVRPSIPTPCWKHCSRARSLRMWLLLCGSILPKKDCIDIPLQRITSM